MSSVYASEPPTSGRVLFDTTHGPLEVQLWCRECPATTRFFLQLCLDGYYDNMLFHRIVPSFLIQTGILRQTVDGGLPAPDDAAARQRMRDYRAAVRADVALERRRYELHSRLRFSHRGQVSMALEVEDDADEDERVDLQPQFFVTLEESKNLDGKYVLFGTVAGPTFFNAARIGGMEVDPETNQPVDLANAPRIRSVRILENPIHQDLAPQPTVPWRVPKAASADATRKKKRKGKFDRNVLSFGDEVEESSAAVLFGTRDSDGIATTAAAERNDRVVPDTGTDRYSESKPADEPTDSRSEPLSNSAPEDRDRGQLTEKGDLRYLSLSQRQAATAPAPEPVAGRPAPPPKSQSILEMRNAKYRKSQVNKKAREDDTLAKLFAFKSKVRGQVVGDSAGPQHEDDSLAARMARRAAAQAQPVQAEATTYHGQVLESDDEEHDQKNQDWLKTTFRCRRHIDHTAGGDGRNLDDYDVVDPQAEGNGDPGMRQHRHVGGRSKHRENDKHDHHQHKKHRKHY